MDWDTQFWILSGFSQVEESAQKICGSQPPGQIIQPNTANFYQGLHTCQMFDSEMGICNSTETDIIMQDYFDSSSGERCLVDPQEFSYWCGYTDRDKEDVWLNINNGEPLARTETLWWKAQPNGREHQNCLEASYYAELNSTHWNDQNCDSRICYFCSFSVRPTFTLRGMSVCLTDNFDHKYKWTDVLHDGKYVLQGLQGSRITWTESNKTWTVSSKFNRDFLQLYLQSTARVYPGGLHDWYSDHHCQHGQTVPQTTQVGQGQAKLVLVLLVLVVLVLILLLLVVVVLVLFMMVLVVLVVGGNFVVIAGGGSVVVVDVEAGVVMYCLHDAGGAPPDRLWVGELQLP